MESERHLSPEDEEQMESDIINSVMADLFPPSLDDHNNNNNNKRSSVRITETTVEITTNGHSDDTVTSFTDHDVTWYNNDVTINGDDIIESVVDKSDDEDDVTNNHDDVTNVNNEAENVNKEVVVEETNEYGFNFDDIIGNLGRKDDERNDDDANEEEAEKADEAYEMMMDEQLDHFEKEVASELESMIEEELTKDFQEGFEEGANEMVGALSEFIGGGEYGNKTTQEEEEKVEEQEQEQKEDQPVYEVLEPAVDYDQNVEISGEENIYQEEQGDAVIIADQVDNNDIIISHDDEVYDDNHVSDIAEKKLRHDDVIAELKQDMKEIETTTCSCTCKCKCSTSHHHTADHTQVTSAELQQTSDAQTKQRPASTSGTFVLRTVAKANPQHVVKYVTENQTNIVQHNPEQDELVTYLKGTSEGGSIQNRIRSLITSPLIQQFNKETGSENVQTFLPKQVMVANRAPSLSVKLANGVNGANGAKEPETPQITQEVPVISPPVEKMVIESISDPQARNAELAKAIEAAQFKPTHITQASIQISRTPRASEEGEERTVSVGQGISIYSRQPNTPSSAGVLSPGVEDKGLEWKAEVQRRKQANELIVAQKVNEPLKLAQVPEWKRVLMEKNKQRKQSSNEAEDEHKNGVKPSDEGNTELEWKKEIKQILREKERNGQTAEEMPEWQRIANKQ